MQRISALKEAILDELLEHPCQEVKSLNKSVRKRKPDATPAAISKALSQLCSDGMISKGYVVHLNRYTGARKHYVFIQTNYPWEHKDWDEPNEDYQGHLMAEISNELRTGSYPDLLLIGIRKIIGGPCDIVMELATSPGGFDTVTDFVTNYVRRCTYVSSTTTASEVLPTDGEGDYAIPDVPR
ncbi:MAG: hypothetical protein H6813_06605 [Phycisphaeraceae bacterium]|nr:hypothetical protein [Phycisphaeraceae bacterium]MCB9848141.1 hypothetical protein [Phycisphaeraceae bacterium]